LISIYYRAWCLTNSRTVAQVKKVDLDRIPLPPIDLSCSRGKAFHDKVVDLVSRMLDLRKQCLSRSDLSVAKQISSVDREIDQIVLQLYGFSEDEVTLAREPISPCLYTLK
jgi:phosphate uptake regulator